MKINERKKRKKILVVDDDNIHCFMLNSTLSRWGYKISTAEDGLTAIEKVQKQIFDLVLMDIRMPRVSGLEALVEIKSYNPSLPVILMTAYVAEENVAEARKRGASDFLTKPFDMDELKKAIGRALTK
jgi:two-component system response regulator HydG